MAASKQDRKLKTECEAILRDSNPEEDHARIGEAQTTLDRALETEFSRKVMAAKVKYVEEGERCTAFFFACAKSRSTNSNIKALQTETGLVTNAKEIEKIIYDQHEQLYKARKPRAYDLSWERLIPKIGMAERSRAEMPITMKDTRDAIFKKMSTGKAPGNDGLTVGLYRSLWPVIKDHILLALSESLRTGCLSSLQKQSVIRLILKKDKDSQCLKNWRPISLMNTDTKILAKILASRLDRTLPLLAGENQHAFIPGRNIHHGTRLVQQAMERGERSLR